MLKAEVSRQIKDLEEQGKIKKSNGPFAHQVVCVMKPSGDVRLCIDLRLVNSMTVDDRQVSITACGRFVESR